MIQFKETSDRAHGYLICRFDVCYLIDPSAHIEDILSTLAGRQLLGILLTHAHHDHVDLIGSFEVPIYLHLDDAHLLFEDKYNGYYPNTHPYKRKQLNLNYVVDQQKLTLADQYVTCIHTPGHTKGSMTYLYDQKLFTGDTLFKESVGRHDLYSGSLPQLKRSVIKLLSLDANYKIHPGHDASSSVRHEQKKNPYYVKWKQQLKI